MPTVTLKPGMKIEGIVDGVADFGVFVRVSGRTSGLLHVSQLGDKGRQGALSSKFPEGSKVNVVVKEVKGDRIALTLAENWERQKEEAEAVSEYVKKDTQANNDANNLGSLGDSLAGLDL
jgi:ribosomal protein S1